ncbi:hypothetical protein H0H92_010435 [Tricholoma furcatifolium]|nr:hypothetical protein H0H92_010435 [Tricholoma furcatifolium]
MFTSYELNLGESTSRRFEVTLSPPGATGDRPPKVHTVTVTKVNEINLEVLNQFVAGRYSLDEEVLTAIMALNVVVRMDPSEKYPFNVRSFFTNRETRDIGSGFVLWRGYFQSVRPGIGRMLLNVDISTAMMYKSGRLPDLCLEFLGQAGKNPSVLAPARGFPDRERLRLQRFLSGLKITTAHTPGTRPNVPRVIKKLTAAGADGLHFNFNGTMKSVADYFRTEKNRPLQFPGVICVEVGSGALLPLEMCFVPEGQIMKKQIPPDKTTAMVEFATMKPNERFRSIENGSQSVLAYGQSEYVRKFGMTVETANGFLPIDARVLPPPTLRYGQTNKQPTIQLRAAGAAVAKNKGSPPNLMVVILPDANNAEIYTAVKKINPKLGGINAILDPSSARVLNDPKVPTIVMGADAMHPAPGSEGRPSFTAVVGNIDSNNARYIATTRAQTSKQELIDDLQEMCKHILGSYAGYRVGVEKKPASEAPPKRLIFFRDGVSEGQFEQVLQTELPRIKAACAELKMNPKITLIIVGKRHHVRFKTQKDSDADKSGKRVQCRRDASTLIRIMPRLRSRDTICLDPGTRVLYVLDRTIIALMLNVL